MQTKCTIPSIDQWLTEAKADPSAKNIGMFLTHVGVVRRTSKAEVHFDKTVKPVTSMLLSYSQEKVNSTIHAAYQMPGIYYIKVWINEGVLNVGDDIMHVLVGGDIRSHAVEALQFLVSELKSHCIKETELFQ